MFGFLKNKLKEWTQGVKDKLKSEEEPEEKVEETITEKEKIEVKPKEEKEPVEEEKKKEKKTKKEKKAAALSKSKDFKPTSEIKVEKVDEIIEKAKKEEIIEIPLEFNAGLQKYEPDTEKIKEEKQGFLKKLFSKKKKEESEEIKEKVEEVKEELKKEEETIEKLEKDKEKLVKETDLLKIEPDIRPIKEPIVEQEPEIKQEKKSFFQKLKSTFTYKITEESFEDIFNGLEMLLLENNAALEVVEDIKKLLSKKLIGKEIKKDDLEKTISNELKSALNELIINPIDPLTAIKNKKENIKEPYVILFFGINGTGKTTSIAKIANLLKKNNYSVVLAAGDTFRAASIEQIQEHANKLNVPLIKHDYQADPSAVGFDAIKYAKTHHIDVVLIDTAGRMHTKTNLIAEMEKICRVTKPDLKVFVAESIAGNDATEQAKTFNEAIGIDGSILSKADVDEKGGTIISVSHATNKPIFYLGTGQNYEDIKLFNKDEYIESLGL